MRIIFRELISPDFIKESIDHIRRTRTLNFHDSRNKEDGYPLAITKNKEDEELRVECDGQWKQSIVIYRR
jgi:hypothetical protein